jgi:hypothetical protein
MLAVKVNFLLLFALHRRFLHLLKLWLNFHFLTVPTGAHALLTSVEVAFLAMMELVGHLSAYLALSTRLKISQSQLVFVIASLEDDRLARKTVTDAVLIAVGATQSNYLLLIAECVGIVPILRASHIGQDMIFITFEDDGTLLVYCNALTVGSARSAQSKAADLIIIIFLLTISASHTTKMSLIFSYFLDLC